MGAEKLFNRDEIQRIVLQKIEQVEHKKQLEVPEMVEIVTSVIEEVIQGEKFLPDFVDRLIDLQNQ